jgi:hypothetical protein
VPAEPLEVPGRYYMITYLLRYTVTVTLYRNSDVIP